MTASVPVSISADGSAVRQLELDPADLAHAFFDETVTSLLPIRRTSVAAVDELFLDTVSVDLREPRFVVLHVGRCGSTVAARLLASSTGRPRLSEPSVLNQCAWAAAGTGHGETSAWLRRYAVVLAMMQMGLGSRTVLKPSSWCAVHGMRFAELFPSAQLVVLLRDPVEVLRSMAAQPPEWVTNAQSNPAVARRLLAALGAEPAGGEVLDSLGIALWICVARQAAQLHLSGRALVSWPSTGAQLLDDIEDWCSATGEAISLAGRRRAAEEVHWYAKGGGGRVPFEPSGRHHRPHLDPRREQLVRDATEPARVALLRAGVVGRTGVAE